MPENSVETQPAEASITQILMEAYSEKPSQENTEKTGQSQTINNVKAQVHNNGNIGAQNFNFAEELIDIKSLLTGFDINAIRKAKWEHGKDGEESLDYQSNLNRLLEDHIIFVSAEDHANGWSLAYHISCNEILKRHEKKQVFFGHANKKIEFGLMELVQKMNAHEDKFIICDLTAYNIKACQRKFLESLTSQLHHDSLQTLKEKKIYIVALVTAKVGHEIKSGLDNYQRYFHVWSINDVEADQLQVPDTKALFDNLNYIQRVLLYAGTFFNGISFRSFDSIVKLLLSGATNNIPVALEVYKDFDDGAKKIMKVIDDDKIKVWESYKDRFFKDCCLVGKDEAGMYIVDFTHPGLLEKCRAYFKGKEHFFWQEQFFIIERSGLVFSPNDHIAARVIDIILEAITDDPDYYDDDWFWQMAMDIKDFENGKLATEADTPEEQVYRIWDSIRRSDNAYFFYNRFGQILAQMLNKGLGDRIKPFLERLIKYADHDVLLKLTQRLAHLEAFDKFYWIKQLIERGNIEIKNKTYRWLVNKVVYYDRKKTWEAIVSWLPADKKIVNYSPSNHYASFFIIHFYVNEIIELPVTSHGAWPNTYALFADYDENTGKCREHITFMLQQAFHEGTEYQFSSNNLRLLYLVSEELLCLNYSREDIIRDMMNMDEPDAEDMLLLGYTPTYQSLLADIAETWFHILVGYEGNAPSGSVELNAFTMATFMGECKKRPQCLDKMIRHWEKKHAIYKKQLDRIKKYQEEHKEELDNDDADLVSLLIGSIVKRRENLIRFNEQLGAYL